MCIPDASVLCHNVDATDDYDINKMRMDKAEIKNVNLLYNLSMKLVRDKKIKKISNSMLLVPPKGITKP